MKTYLRIAYRFLLVFINFVPMQKQSFGYVSEALIYPLLFIIMLWMIQWMGNVSTVDFYKFGLLPRSFSGLKGIVFMPLLHSQHDLHHLINNSVVFFLLLGSLIYFYRGVAFRVLIFSWLLTGLLVWIYANNRGAYHIGMSGVIYALLGFLFVSGVLRKYLPLQALSLLIVFLYGNMIWGIFPIRANVSWEGHFMGLLVGVILAFVYRHQAVITPKYQYEVEEEAETIPDPTLEESILISPPNSSVKFINTASNRSSSASNPTQKIVYHYTNSKKTV